MSNGGELSTKSNTTAVSTRFRHLVSTLSGTGFRLLGSTLLGTAFAFGLLYALMRPNLQLDTLLVNDPGQQKTSGSPAVFKVVVSADSPDNKNFTATVLQPPQKPTATVKVQELTNIPFRKELLVALREENARFTWLATVIFQTALLAGLSILCFNTIRRHGGSDMWFCLTCGVVCVALIIVFFTRNRWLPPVEDSLHSQLFQKMQQLTKTEFISYATGLFNGWGFAVAMAIVCSLGLILNERDKRIKSEGPNVELPQLAEQFRMLLFGTAALLVASTFQIASEHSWAAALFSGDEIVASIKQVAISASFAYAAMFTTIAGFVFLPVTFLFNSRKPLDVFTELLAVVSPLLAVLPVASLFQ